MAAGACTCRTQEGQTAVRARASLIRLGCSGRRTTLALNEGGATAGEVSPATRLATCFSECPCLQGLQSAQRERSCTLQPRLCVAPMIQNITYGWWVVALALAALAIWLLP
jgi:hypothetical protein